MLRSIINNCYICRNFRANLSVENDMTPHYFRHEFHVKEQDGSKQVKLEEKDQELFELNRSQPKPLANYAVPPYFRFPFH